MNHEHEQSRTGSTSTEFARSDDDKVEPGKSSRSAPLRKPEYAVASGLVQRDASDGGLRSFEDRLPVRHHAH